jgi:4-hydroxy 2-oxovalerate aldolase
MDYIIGHEPVGFSKSLLDKLINEGIIGGFGKIQNNESIVTSPDTLSHKVSLSYTDVPYINRYKNRDFLVLANGPSLKEYKDKINIFIDKYNPVILGANYLGGLYKPHYHAFNNKRRFTEYIDSVAPESRILIGQYIPDEMIREYTDRNYEKIYYKDVVNPEFGIIDGIITTNCRTIAVLLIGIAIVMGAKRVFAVGMDGYLGINTKDSLHFYYEKHEKEDKEKLIEIHQCCQRFIGQIDQYLTTREKEGFHILTPTSYKLFYKGIENYI